MAISASVVEAAAGITVSAAELIGSGAGVGAVASGMPAGAASVEAASVAGSAVGVGKGGGVASACG